MKEEMPPPNGVPFRQPEAKTDRELLLQVCDAIAAVQAAINDFREKDLKTIQDGAADRERRIKRVELWQKWLTGAIGVGVAAGLAAAGYLNNQMTWVRDLILAHITSMGGRTGP